MIDTVTRILEVVLDRLSGELKTYLPSLLAAIIFVLGALLLATVIRWLLYKIFKGPEIDRFLRRSGLVLMLDPSGSLRATRLVAETVYWCILLGGVLLGVSAFDTRITTQITEKLLLLFVKLVIAVIVIMAGAWLGRYLSRTIVVWGVNEGFPWPRRLAGCVRILTTFAAVVVAADQLDFARSVFLAAFVILTGGAMLSISLALGIGASNQVGRFLQSKQEDAEESHNRSLLNHL